MAFPTVAARSSGATPTSPGNVTSHPITLPSGIVAGDLLVIVFSTDGNPTCSIASGGWTKHGQASNGTVVTGAVFYKTAAGGDTATVTTSASEQSSHVTLRITDWSGTPAGPSANGSGTNSNPPANNPGGGTLDYLWIATRSGDSTVVATAAPSGYSNLQTIAAAGTGGASTNTAERQLNASTEDPGTFTSASEQWVSWTLAIAPVVPPPEGEYTILTSQTPDTEDSAASQERMLGNRFTSTHDGTVVRGRWYVGATATSAATTALWQLWRTSDTTKLVEVDVKALGNSTTNDWIEFDVPDTDITADTQYVVSRYTDDNYPFNYVDPGTFPATNGPLSTDTGVFINNLTSNDYPSNTDTAMFFVDVVANYGGMVVDLDATGNAASIASAEASVTRSITTTASAAAAATGTAVVARGLIATGSAASHASATMATDRPLTAAGSAAAHATADLTVGAAPIQLDATGAAAASATGDLATSRTLTAAAPTAATGTGTLGVGRSLDATAGTASTATGDLTRQAGLTGTAPAAATGTADLSIQGQVSLSATGAAAGTAGGTLTVARGLTATAASAASATGQLGITLAFTGKATTAADATAELIVGHTIPLDAQAAAAMSASGDLIVMLPYIPAFVGVDGATTSSVVDHHSGAGTVDFRTLQPADLAGSTGSTYVDL